MGKFIISEDSPAKKSRTSAFDSPKKKMPRPSEMNNLSMGSSSSVAALGDNAMHAYVCKYADNGALYSQWHASSPLYVVNLQCDVRPSPLLYMKKMVAGFAEMRANMPAEEEDKSNLVPYSLEDLCREMQATYNFTGKQTSDEDDVGFTLNRSAFYVSHVKAFLMYFDELLHWRSTYVNEEEGLSALTWSPKVIVHLGPGIDFEIAEEDGVKCEFEHEQFDKVHDVIFQVPPPTYPHRVCIMYFEMVNDNIVHIQIGGNTKPYLSNFVALKIKGQTHKPNPNDAYGEYFRIIKHVDIAKDLKTQLRVLFGSQGLCGSPVVIRLHETTGDITLLRTNLEVVAEFSNVKIDF